MIYESYQSFWVLFYELSRINEKPQGSKVHPDNLVRPPSSRPDLPDGNRGGVGRQYRCFTRCGGSSKTTEWSQAIATDAYPRILSKSWKIAVFTSRRIPLSEKSCFPGSLNGHMIDSDHFSENHGSMADLRRLQYRNRRSRVLLGPCCRLPTAVVVIALAILHCTVGNR